MFSVKALDLVFRYIMDTRSRSSTRLAVQNNAPSTSGAKRASSQGKAPAKKQKPNESMVQEDDSVSEVDFPSLQDMVNEAIAKALPGVVSKAVTEAIPQLVAAMPPLQSVPVGTDLVGGQSQSREAALSVAANIAGGEVENKVQSVALPPDLHLSEDQKSKIVGDKYVKFGTLLFRDQQNEKKLTLKLNSSSNSPSFVVDPNENSVKIRYIEVWDRAFTIYQYRYVQAHPEQAQGLLMYGRLIKDMAWRGLGWLQYDEQFRRLRETDPNAYPWGAIEPNLWATWALPRAIGQFSNNSNTIGRGQSRGGRGYFNSGMGFENSFGRSSNNGHQGGNSFSNGYAGNSGRGHSFGFSGRGTSFGSNRGSRFANRQFGNNRQANGNNMRPPCFRFNAGRYCRQPCDFGHVCMRCGSNGHGENNCQ